jgi:capsid portal protein
MSRNSSGKPKILAGVRKKPIEKAFDLYEEAKDFHRKGRHMEAALKFTKAAVQMDSVRHTPNVLRKVSGLMELAGFSLLKVSKRKEAQAAFHVATEYVDRAHKADSAQNAATATMVEREKHPDQQGKTRLPSNGTSISRNASSNAHASAAFNLREIVERNRPGGNPTHLAWARAAIYATIKARTAQRPITPAWLVAHLAAPTAAAHPA